MGNSEYSVETSTVETATKGKRGRPVGAKNLPKYDAQGNIIPLKKDLILNRPKGKRGRPKGSKNLTSTVETVSTFQPETTQTETFVLPMGVAQ